MRDHDVLPATHSDVQPTSVLWYELNLQATLASLLRAGDSVGWTVYVWWVICFATHSVQCRVTSSICALPWQLCESTTSHFAVSSVVYVCDSCTIIVHAYNEKGRVFM